eukprot:gene16549-22778_t
MKELQLLTPENWSRSEPCKLVVVDGGALPLVSRSIVSNVNCVTRCADVIETFTFNSKAGAPVKFVFTSPIRSTVYSFQADIRGQEMFKEIRSQEEAFTLVELYNPTDDGKLQPRHVTFNIEPPGGEVQSKDECILAIKYSQKLLSSDRSKADECMEFDHCSSWVAPGSEGSCSSSGDPDSYKLSYKLNLMSSYGFKTVESPNSGVIITFPSQNDRYVTLDREVLEPSICFALFIELHAAPQMSKLGTLPALSALANDQYDAKTIPKSLSSRVV